MPHCAIPGCDKRTRLYLVCGKHFREFADGHGELPAWVKALVRIERREQYVRRHSPWYEIEFFEDKPLDEYWRYDVMKTRQDGEMYDGLPMFPYDTDDENEAYLQAHGSKARVADASGWSELRIEKWRRRRAEKYGTKYDISRAELETIFSWGCLVCDTHAKERLVLAHDVPVCRGGDTTWNNCYCLCRRHNIRQFTQTLKEWRPDLIPKLDALRFSASKKELAA